MSLSGGMNERISIALETKSHILVSAELIGSASLLKLLSNNLQF
jgi:hypothetical protein